MTVRKSDVWEPATFGRSRLGHGCSSVLIEAPFAMDASATGLLGWRISIDGGEHEVRGVVPSMPVASIAQGQLIEILVSDRA